MKTLSELYAEVIASDVLKAEFVALKTPEDVVAFAKKHGCDATLDDITAFFEEKNKAAGELSEAELEQVAGGKSASVFEGLMSACTVGVICLIGVGVSLVTGKVGTAIKGKCMICSNE